MERNTVLAVILSVVALFAYQILFVAPNASKFKTQIVSNQQVNESSHFSPQISHNGSEETTKLVNRAEDYYLKTPDATISYTNVGGSIHKIDFSENKDFPLTSMLAVAGFENALYQGVQNKDQGIEQRYQDQDIEIRKIFTIKDRNCLNVSVTIKSRRQSGLWSDPVFTLFQIDQSVLDTNKNNRETALFEYSIFANNKIFRKGNAVKFNDKNNQLIATEIHWAGFRDHYHAVIVKPEFKTKVYEIKTDTDRVLEVLIKPQAIGSVLASGATYNFTVYIGPQDPWLMKKYGKDFDKIVAFSGFPLIEWISQAIYYTVPFFHSIFKSWGVAIILVSILIYAITYPLTMQSMISMRKMQEIQPKIKALQEKYKNDAQKLNVEMMEIYRREKINPLGGCLPFLIQMPFFMALYQILWRAQYFQGQKFLWIKDLSLPDRLAEIPMSLPLFGNELNILPILTGAVMFIQQKISSKNMIVVDEQQAMQQKMMMYILPVMMTCMFYHFASSWAVYFLVFYILSTATQWRISKLSGK